MLSIYSEHFLPFAKPPTWRTTPLFGCPLLLIQYIRSLRRRLAVVTGTACHAPSITMSRQYSYPFNCRSCGNLLDTVTLRFCEDCSSYMYGLYCCPSTGSSLVTPNPFKIQITIMYLLFSVAFKAVTLGEEEWPRVFDRRVTGHGRKQHYMELWLFRAHEMLFGWSNEG